MTDIEERTKSIIKTAATKLSPITYLSGRVRGMDREDVNQLAIAYLYAQVRNRQRGGVRGVERAAQKKPAYGTAAWRRWAALPENANEAASKIALEERLEREFSDGMTEVWQSFDASMAKLKDSWRMEWTDELLASKFALGDGTEISWGDATREHHEYRYKMHAHNAVAGMEGAARHQQAIETLDATGASTLSEAIGVAA